MIISASRRTDIPAFYSKWFIDCIHKGSCAVVNPFNPNQIREVSLLPNDVDAIVFWTRYPKPLMHYLNELSDRGYTYIFLFTITGYPKWLEPNAKRFDETINVFKKLSQSIGAHKVIWRYDPILFSRELDFSFHLQNFHTIAKQLYQHTHNVVISIMEPYPKVVKRLTPLLPTKKIVLNPFDAFNTKVLLQFFQSLQDIATLYGLHLQSCCSPLEKYGIERGPCINAELIQSITGIQKQFAKDPHQRTYCLCAKSVDIGMYNSCKCGCLYCYANK